MDIILLFQNLVADLWILSVYYITLLQIYGSYQFLL
jgi:hypothetical protein